MPQFNHSGLEAEPPWLQDSVPVGSQPPAGPHIQSCACVHEAAQVFQYVACSSWLSPSASLGTKGLKSLINPVASSSSNCYRKENALLNQRQKFLNFGGPAHIIGCWTLTSVSLLIAAVFWKRLVLGKDMGAAAPCLCKGGSSFQGTDGTNHQHHG